MAIKAPARLSMRDRLAHLGFEEAAKLLGPDGGKMLIRGGRLELAAASDLHIDDREASIRWRDEGGAPVARIAFDPASRLESGAVASMTSARAPRRLSRPGMV